MQSATLPVGGLLRTYNLYLPSGYTPGRAYPLVLALHGGGGMGRSMARLTDFNRLADAQQFIVVYPDGYRRHWGDGRGNTPSEHSGVDDVAFIVELVRVLRAQLSIDARRIYATGMSNGGFFAFRLGCLLSGIIAAIAPVAATLPASLTAVPPPERPVPLLMIHGTDDRLVPASGGLMRVGAGGHILSTGESAAFWARRNGADASFTTENLPVSVNDGTWVQRATYNCPPQASVQLYSIVNGGHAWPGGWPYLPARVIGATSRNLDASTLVWDFFQAHTLP